MHGLSTADLWEVNSLAVCSGACQVSDPSNPGLMGTPGNDSDGVWEVKWRGGVREKPSKIRLCRYADLQISVKNSSMSPASQQAFGAHHSEGISSQLAGNTRPRQDNLCCWGQHESVSFTSMFNFLVKVSIWGFVSPRFLHWSPRTFPILLLSCLSCLKTKGTCVCCLASFLPSSRVWSQTVQAVLGCSDCLCHCHFVFFSRRELDVLSHPQLLTWFFSLKCDLLVCLLLLTLTLE